MRVVIPPGVGAGQVLQVRAPNGQLVQVKVPVGVLPGQTLQFSVRVKDDVYV